MEKRTPHCTLTVVKAMVNADQVRATKAAREGAVALGLDFDGMLAVVLALSTGDFYKSMTTHADHHVWQDVYRPTTPVGEVYLKLTVIDDVLIVSFNLESAIGRGGVCGFWGPGQGATRRNGCSIPTSCNEAMGRKNRAIRPVAGPPTW